MDIYTLIDNIGFDEAEKNECLRYRSLIGDRFYPVAKRYMSEEIGVDEAFSEGCTLAAGLMADETSRLMLVIECFSLLWEKYEEKGFPEERFIDALHDIKYKVTECLKVKKVFGLANGSWFNGFLKMKCIAFGRLQFNPLTFDREDIVLDDFTLTKGDFYLNCHIPSAGPLKEELCIESLKMAHSFYKDRLKGGILPVICTTWLLYPPYLEVFGEKSNTYKFAGMFNIISLHDDGNFQNAWRIFNRAFEGDTSVLPRDTAMQRSFIDYIDKGGSFGRGMGVLLFDGEKVLTSSKDER